MQKMKYDIDALKGVEISNEEALSYDAMIWQIAKKHVFKFWCKDGDYSDDEVEASVGRLGMSAEDILQFGRMLVVHQLRWYRVYGKKGKLAASEKTLMYRYLSHKFQSLSKNHSTPKYGGQTVRRAEQRRALDAFVSYTEQNPTLSAKEVIPRLEEIFENCTKEVVITVKRGLYSGEEVSDKFKTADQVGKHVYRKVQDLFSVSAFSLQLTDPAVDRSVFTASPETLLMAKEALMEYAKKNGERAHSYRVLELARSRGIRSVSALAKKVGISNTTLSNVLNGDSPGSDTTRKKLEDFFEEPFSSLIQKVSHNVVLAG